MGARRLGLRTAFVSWIGNDHSGRHMQEALEDEGVDQRYIIVDPKSKTNESTIINFKGEKTQMVYFQPRTYRLPKLERTKCIYYSAMGEKHAGFDHMVCAELKKRPKTFFVFQPGTTHVRQGLKALKPLIARSDLFILNKDEAHFLLKDGERTMCNLLTMFQHLGAKKVIITDGKNGADAWDGTDHWHMPVFTAVATETTGAGDSFAIGATVALLNGLSLPDALRWGTANSWSVIQHTGPQTGLLTKPQIQRVLKRFTKVNAKLIPH